MNIAKILCWNCRGISTGDTSSRVFCLIRTLKPLIVCLVETRANSDRVDRFCNKVPKHWEWTAILAEGFSGGIIVLWYSVVGQVTPLASSQHALHWVVSTSPSNHFCHLCGL